MDAYLRLTITDTLSVLVDGSHAFNPLAKVTRTFWYRLPRDWIDRGRLLPNRRRQLLGLLYGSESHGANGQDAAGYGANGAGSNGRGANGARSDGRGADRFGVPRYSIVNGYSIDSPGVDGRGDHYVILELSEEVLSEEDVSRRPWLSDRAAFYVWREGDVLEEVLPAKL